MFSPRNSPFVPKHEGFLLYQCSPQAVLAYRSDIPYVQKGYRPIRLVYVQR